MSRRRRVVVCYYRVSTAAQSIESQREPCRANAARLAPTAELVELDDVAGAWGRLRVGGNRRRGARRRRRAPREGWSRVMELCEDGRVERVVVAEVSRIARDVEEGVAAINKLEELDVPLYVVRGGYDTSNRRDRQAVLGELVHSEVEGDWLSERTRAGMAKPDAGKPGRPAALDAKQVEEVVARVYAGESFESVAGRFDVSTKTVSRYYRKNRDARNNRSA